jgi:hypothetical protein
MIEKRTAVTRVLVTLVILTLAFAVCMSIALSMVYRERLASVLVFLLASIIDVMLLRPVVIFIESLRQYLRLKSYTNQIVKGRN